MKKEGRRKILKAITIGLAINVFLTIIKITTGLIGDSQALVSDGLNSFSDVFISIILLVVLRVATQKPDDDHHYGHEKFEGLAYFFLAIMFIVTAITISFFSINGVISYLNDPTSLDPPDLITLIVSCLALLVKLWLFRYYVIVSKKYNSTTLKADAKNHLLDAWATLFSIIGISLAQFNLIIFDYIAAIIIALFILKLALVFLKESISYLVDQSPSSAEINDIHQAILSVSGVLSVDDLKIRRHMTQKYVEVEIGAAENLTLSQGHIIAENVHDYIEKEFSEVIHCFVHVNPRPEAKDED